MDCRPTVLKERDVGEKRERVTRTMMTKEMENEAKGEGPEVTWRNEAI